MVGYLKYLCLSYGNITRYNGGSIHGGLPSKPFHLYSFNGVIIYDLILLKIPFYYKTLQI